MKGRGSSRGRPGRHRPATTAVHGAPIDREPGAPIVPPIVQSATFFGGMPDDPGELHYTRYGNNPNQIAVQEKIARLEGADSALLLGSGMGATAMTFLALTGQGDHIVASHYLYGTTRELLDRELPRRGVRTTFVDPGKTREWRAALEDRTRLLFLELPTNPALRVFDLEHVVQLGEEAGIPCVVDSTFASPVNFRPIERGADLVVQSATKYLGGHSDLVAGVVAGPRALVEEIREMMKLYGPAPDPNSAWLLDRGLRTLEVRVQRQNRSALTLARWLEEQEGVERVVYPGLPSHPDHETARELLDGFGGMLAFVLEGGGPAADTFCRNLTVAMVAPSLGGVETLVSQPRHTSHVKVSAAERERQGIPDGFVRVSVGVEDVEDLIEDFGGALARAARGP